MGQSYEEASVRFHHVSLASNSVKKVFGDESMSGSNDPFATEAVWMNQTA